MSLIYTDNDHIATKFSADVEGDSLALEEANNLLIFRKFQQCLTICTNRLKHLQNYHNVANLQTGLCSTDYKESFCVLAIQAYAELNQWQDILPFITKLYSIEEVPPKILQLCVLLHASVKDFPTCSAMTNVWLRNPKNMTPVMENQYLETIDIYVGHVMLPAGKWEEIPAFLESCPGLSQQRREHFTRVSRTLIHQIDQLNAERIETVVESSEPEDVTKTASRKHVKTVIKESHFTSYVNKVSQWARRNIPLVTMHIVRHFSIIALLLYILVTRADIDLLSWATMNKLWMLILTLWRRMFAPFHQVKAN